ncbi:hypothetical protein [Halorubrum trueperi]|uniref:Uncharacterized protein n=1 Tax=Halorubrum trueperi TaxID=2004704 RepID=A0ABD5UKW0_9EURY
MTAVSFPQADGIGRIPLASPPITSITDEFLNDPETATEDAPEAGAGVVVVESDLDGMLLAGGSLS